MLKPLCLHRVDVEMVAVDSVHIGGVSHVVQLFHGFPEGDAFPVAVVKLEKEV